MGRISHRRRSGKSRPGRSQKTGQNSADGSGAAAALTLLVLPGASLMEVRHLATGITSVRCPGCGATKVFTAPQPAGGVTSAAFVHEDDACPVLKRIQAALQMCATAEGGVQ